MAPIRIAIVEDEPLYRGLLENHLARNPRLLVVGSYADGSAALDGMDEVKPDVVTIDVELPGRLDGIQTAIALRERQPDAGIVILSNHADPRFLGALPRRVISGWSYLLKKSVANVEVVDRAVESAATGAVTLDPAIVAAMQPRPGGPLSRLTRRQVDVLNLLAQGLSNAAIAEQLVLAEKSVENQLTAIYAELGLDRRDIATVHPRVSAVLTYLRESRVVPRSAAARP